MNLHALRKASKYLINSPRVLVCVGSGLSAESGVPTFRGADGMFNDPDIARFTHVDTFDEEPEQVLAWYQKRRDQLRDILPNAGHYALARLSTTGEYTIATQNVDHLVERACTEEGFCPPIWHLHGSLMAVKCHDCGRTFDEPDLDLATSPACKVCQGRLRPGVVWFGEGLPSGAFEACHEAAKNADVCLLLGTSGLVYPAASLPETARQFGATLIEINTSMTALSDLCEIILRGKTGEILPVLERAVRDNVT